MMPIVVEGEDVRSGIYAPRGHLWQERTSMG